VSVAYNLPTNGKTIEDKFTIVIQAKRPEQRKMLESQEAIILALTKGAGTCKFITDDLEVPQGCGTEVVTADVNLHIIVKGKVDAGAEINKLQKRQALSESNKEKLSKTIAQPNYLTTVKEEVRTSNTEKVSLILTGHARLVTDNR
jgi:valyl-tRNA synthetase